MKRWQKLLDRYKRTLDSELQMYREESASSTDELEQQIERDLWLVFIRAYSIQVAKSLQKYTTGDNPEVQFHAVLTQYLRDAGEEQMISAFDDVFTIKSMSKVILSMEQLSQLVD
jgi:hypothetical protein